MNNEEALRPPVVAIVSDAIYPYNKGGKERWLGLGVMVSNLRRIALAKWV